MKQNNLVIMNTDNNFEPFSNIVNYPSEDVHNEVFSSMDSSRPSKISKQLNFEIFSGDDGTESISSALKSGTTAVSSSTNSGKKNPTEDEGKKIDPTKLADSVTALGGAVGSTAQTIQAFQNPEKAQARKDLKSVCGRKPLSKKKRAEYDACVEKFQLGKTSAPAPSNEPVVEPPKGLSRNTWIVIGIGAVAVIGYILVKKKVIKLGK